MSIRLRISPDTGEEVQPLPRVVLLGDDRTPEFFGVVHDLQSVIPPNDVTRIRSLAELGERHRHGEIADLVIIVQTWSDEFPFGDFMQLPGIGPCTRLLCCHGPWCVSDGRSRQDWPLVLRLPMEHFGTAIHQEWQQFRDSLTATGTPVPWTAGRDEIFRSQRPAVVAARNPLQYPPIRVVSPDRALAELWLDLFREAGRATAEAPADGQLVLWDVDPCPEAIVAQWTQEHEAFPTTQIIALTGFAGPDEVRKLRDQGAVAVISKLLPVDVLLVKLERISVSAN